MKNPIGKKGTGFSGFPSPVKETQGLLEKKEEIGRRGVGVMSQAKSRGNCPRRGHGGSKVPKKQAREGPIDHWSFSS